MRRLLAVALLSAAACLPKPESVKEHRDNFLDDFIVGWDAKGLDVDSEDRPSAADILSSRMISASFRRAMRAWQPEVNK